MSALVPIAGTSSPVPFVFAGQWTGFTDANVYVFVNVDARRNRAEGKLALFSTIEFAAGNHEGYFFWSDIRAEQISPTTIKGSANRPLVCDRQGNVLTADQLHALLARAPTLRIPRATTFQGLFRDENNIDIQWQETYESEQPQTGTAKLKRAIANGSRIAHQEMTWEQFREFAFKQNGDLIYRGQARRWRLRTTFHKTGRADIVAYLDRELPDLERLINVHSPHLYNIRDDSSLGALLHLAQHHGYPTPLLDWSRSPFVAAFFAFENKLMLQKNGKVSVFVFDDWNWAQRAGRYALLRTPALALRTLELPAHGNPRVLPQQSVTMYSNVDDIEHLIQQNESKRGEFITAIALPVSEREAAMRDLGLMGITWGSLFPSLDGSCKELAIRHFGERS